MRRKNWKNPAAVYVDSLVFEENIQVYASFEVFLEVLEGMLYINNSRHLAWKYARIFVRRHYLFREANSFRERSSKKTVSYEEQIMSKDKYPSIFSPQMEAIVFIILQIFFATRAIFKIGEYSWIFHSFSWGIFDHVTRLDQSRVSEKIWWIIIWVIFQWVRETFRLATPFTLKIKVRSQSMISSFGKDRYRFKISKCCKLGIFVGQIWFSTFITKIYIAALNFRFSIIWFHHFPFSSVCSHSQMYICTDRPWENDVNRTAISLRTAVAPFNFNSWPSERGCFAG